MGHTKQPATGPALVEQLAQLRAEFDAFAEEARSHWKAEDQRFTNIDAFIDPTMELQSLLKQLFGILTRNHDSVKALERIFKEEMLTARKALALHLSSEDIRE